jgi:phi13 family phage major tail protein
MPNVLPTNYAPMVGVDMFYFALMSSDVSGGTATYEDPVRIDNVVNTAFSGNSQTATYYADNAAKFAVTQLGEMSLAVQSADIPPAIQAIWLGQKYNNGVLVSGQINPRDMAIGYRIKKVAEAGANESYRYVWFLKAKPGLSDAQVNTQTNSIAFQDATTNFAIVTRTSDGDWQYMVDDEDPNLLATMTPAQLAANFFTSPEWCITTIYDAVQG